MTVSSRVEIAFYFVGIALIIIATILFINTEPEVDSRKLDLDIQKSFPENEIISLSDFVKSESLKKINQSIVFDPNGMTVLYLVNTDYCTPCTNEVSDFSRIISHSKYYEYDIQQLMYVADQDMKRAERFVKTSNFSFPIIYGFDNEYTPILKNYESKEQSRQVIFVENKTGKIVLRKILPKGVMTPVSTKKHLLDEANKALKDAQTIHH